MIRSIKKAAALFVAVFAMVFGVSLVPALTNASPAFAQSGPSTDLKEGICSGTEAAGVDDCANADDTGVKNLVKTIINVLSWVIGVVSVIMIIVGGFRYIISSGDSGQVTSAKNTIMYAIVGLVIVLFAQVIVRFVIGSVTKTTG
jgi:hypothetical protein